jgi:HTH-type transcriptional regulator / antitoxin HigA
MPAMRNGIGMPFLRKVSYEDRHFAIPAPDPIEAIQYFMESRDLSRRDLEPYLGSRARVSEILNRKRPLSLEMIRELNKGLGIPAEVLIKPYRLRVPHAPRSRATA